MGNLLFCVNIGLLFSKNHAMKVIIKSFGVLAIFFSLEGFLTPHTIIAKIPRKSSALNTAAITIQEPTVTIEQINTSKKIIVYVTDSANSAAEISQKFMKIIPVELGGFLKKNNLQWAGPPCAWYNGNQPP